MLKSWTYPATPRRRRHPEGCGQRHLRQPVRRRRDADGHAGLGGAQVRPHGQAPVERSPTTAATAATRPTAWSIDHHGDVIVAGTSEHAGGYDDAVVKWSPSGTLKWKRTISATGMDLVAAPRRGRERQRLRGRATQGRVGAAKTAILRSWTSSGRQRWTATAANRSAACPSWRFLEVKGTSVYVAGQSTGILATLGLHGHEVHHCRQARLGRHQAAALRERRTGGGPGRRRRGRGGRSSARVFDAGASGEDARRGVEAHAPPAPPRGDTSFADAGFAHDGRFGAVGVDSTEPHLRSRRPVVTARHRQPADACGTRPPASARGACGARTGSRAATARSATVLRVSDSQVLAAGQVAGNGANAGVYRAGCAGVLSPEVELGGDGRSAFPARRPRLCARGSCGSVGPRRANR